MWPQLKEWVKFTAYSIVKALFPVLEEELRLQLVESQCHREERPGGKSRGDNPTHQWAYWLLLSLPRDRPWNNQEPPSIPQAEGTVLAGMRSLPS